VTDVAACSVRLQLFCVSPPLEQPPDQMASRPLLTVSVTRVPAAKLAVPVAPTATLSPAGLEETDSPERPVAVTVSGTPVAPPPQVCGATHDPQPSVPPQPFAIVPQLFPWAAHVVGVHVVPGFTVRIAVAVPLEEAERVSAVEVLTADVVTGNVAVSCPAATRRLDGTVATALLLERKTPRPPAGAALLRVTVPVEPLPPVTGFGLSDSADTPAEGGAAPH